MNLHLLGKKIHFLDIVFIRLETHHSMVYWRPTVCLQKKQKLQIYSKENRLISRFHIYTPKWFETVASVCVCVSVCLQPSTPEVSASLQKEGCDRITETRPQAPTDQVSHRQLSQCLAGWWGMGSGGVLDKKNHFMWKIALLSSESPKYKHKVSHELIIFSSCSREVFLRVCTPGIS